MAQRQFGISTHLYHGQRLSRDHLLEIAARRFETVEVFATRTHFDYHNVAAIADLQQWLAEAGLTLHGVEAGKLAGMAVLAVTNSYPRERLLAADAVIDGFAGLTIGDIERLISGVTTDE